MERVGLVIGIVGAVFFGGCICILFIVLLKNFFRNRPTLLLDSGQSADLRTGKRDIHHDRVAAHCGFQRIPNLRAEIHPDRTPRSRTGRSTEEKTGLPKGIMRWQMKYFGSPYAITASTVDLLNSWDRFELFFILTTIDNGFTKIHSQIPLKIFTSKNLFI